MNVGLQMIAAADRDWSSIVGFGGIAVAAAGIAKVLFFIFIVLFLIGLLTGRRPV